MNSFDSTRPAIGLRRLITRHHWTTRSAGLHSPADHRTPSTIQHCWTTWGIRLHPADRPTPLDNLGAPDLAGWSLDSTRPTAQHYWTTWERPISPANRWRPMNSFGFAWPTLDVVGRLKLRSALDELYPADRRQHWASLGVTDSA